MVEYRLFSLSLHQILLSLSCNLIKSALSILKKWTTISFSISVTVTIHQPHILSAILPTSPFPSLSLFLLSSDRLLFSYFHHNPSLAICLPCPHFRYVHFSFSLSPSLTPRWILLLIGGSWFPDSVSPPPCPPLSVVVTQRSQSKHTRKKLSDAHFASKQHSTG